MLPYQTQEVFAGMHHNAPMAYGNSGMGGMIPGMNMPRSDTGIPDRSDLSQRSKMILLHLERYTQVLSC